MLEDNDKRNKELNKLKWELVQSKGEFNIYIAHCNYPDLRNEVNEAINKDYAGTVCLLEINKAYKKSLYEKAKESLSNDNFELLIIYGLEELIYIDSVLTITNKSRNEFTNLKIPIILWVTDEVIQKIIRLAPDFEDWANFSYFTFDLKNNEKEIRIKSITDNIYKKILIAGAGTILANTDSALNNEYGLNQKVVLETIYKDVKKKNLIIDVELEASLEFCIGLYKEELISESKEHFNVSLMLWDRTKNYVRRGCAKYYLGRWWRTRALTVPKNEEYLCLKQTERLLESAIRDFETSSNDLLVGSFINSLAEVLHRQHNWPRLEDVSRKALAILYKVNGDKYRIARAYGFLSEVKLNYHKWDEAIKYAKNAIRIFPNDIPLDIKKEEKDRLDWEFSYHMGWYILPLAKSLFKKNKLTDASSELEKAKQITKPEYDPYLYIEILKELKVCYRQLKKYKEAFQLRVELESVEQQYGVKTFVGAAQLQPKKQYMNPALVNISEKEEIAEELVLSGRMHDIEEMIMRLSRSDMVVLILHGPSGVGKTSLLQAGLVPALQKKEYLNEKKIVTILYPGIYSSWQDRLSEKLYKAFKFDNSENIIPSHDNLEDLIKKIKTISKKNDLSPIIIFEQFEKFFFSHQKLRVREKFYQIFRSLIDIPDAKIILSLREDYLHYLLECERICPLKRIDNDILNKQNLYYLGKLSIKDVRNLTRIFLAKK